MPSASSSDLLSIANKLRQIAGGLSRPRPNLFVMTPFVLPLPASAFARALNRHLLIGQIKSALKKIGKGPIQIWSFTPDISYVLDHFGEEKIVYYCVDDHAAFSGYNKEQVLRDEEQLCRLSDLVVTTSMALQEKKGKWNRNTVLVPHGVDYEHFRRAAEEDLPCPSDLISIPRPRLGFIGLIRDWVDVELLAQVARRRPEWSVVLIGDADSNVNIGQYGAVSNMHFLGRKPYEELPPYCRHFDVGLIPFKINELTKAVNPIKLREYLSAGLPVVSTPLPEVGLYKELVEIAATPADFEKSVEKCLASGEPERLARLGAMASESWDRKLDRIEAGLSEAAHNRGRLRN